MGTAISRGRLAGLGALVAAVGLMIGGCGGAAGGSFAWLRPAPPPTGWSLKAIEDGAVLSYPSGWERIHGDPGTTTAVLLGQHRQIVGYLNATPRQGTETLSNWARFRVEHNGDEGDRGVKALANRGDLRFRTGRGACVKDSYRTASGAPYIEVACLVAGKRAASVIVGAAPPSHWARVSPMLERAISAFST